MATSLFPDFIPAPRPRKHRTDNVRAMRLVNHAAQRINSILDLDTLLDQIVSDVMVEFGFGKSSILLMEPDGEHLVLAASQGCICCNKGVRYLIGQDGLVGHAAATGQTIYTPDVSREPRYISCGPDMRSEVDIPLFAHGRLIGVFSANHSELDGFPPEQLEVLHELAGHIAVAVENARRFQQERKERERLHGKEQEARFIQQALFPRDSPRVPGFAIYGSCVPSDAVGGDWYDHFPLGGGRWALVLGDVCGKGVAAALTMSAARALVRSFALTGESPSAVLARVNRVLMEDLPAGKFVTMVFAVLNATAHTLTFANAGHPWPLFVDGKPHLLRTSSGLPLGIAESSFEERRIALPSGSRLLLYSDGITEACNLSGEEYGIRRLYRQAASEQVSPDSVLSDVRAFARGVALADDATLIVLRTD